jgi:hypothetical protein
MQSTPLRGDKIIAILSAPACSTALPIYQWRRG